MYIQKVGDYVSYRLRAKTRHGTHSPFVYRLVDEIIYDFSKKKIYDEVETRRQELLSDERVINVTGLGAGSHNNSPEKKISEIAAISLKPARDAQLMYRLVADLKPGNMIELGTSLGITSVYLRKGAPQAKFYTLEGCPKTAGIATEVFKKAGTTGIKQVTGDFDDSLPAVLEELDRLDFAFIDGNHTREATLRYFEWCLPKVHDDTLLVFDDIYWSEGMKQAWDQIKAHPRVTVTIDMFRIGLVYFRKAQVKEDFVIRF